MRKIYLFVVLSVLAFGFGSCSSDEKSVSGTVLFKLGGIQKTTKVVWVKEYKNFEGTKDEFTEIMVFAKSKTDNTKVRFAFKKGYFGNIFDEFTYFYKGVILYEKASDFSGNIIASGEERKLIGTFSGHVGPAGENLNITEGTFDIQY